MAWTLLKKGEAFSEFGGYHMEFMIDSDTDIDSPDDRNAAPGSVAYTPDLGSLYLKGADAAWHKAGE